MIDTNTLADQIFLAADHVQFLTPPRFLNSSRNPVGDVPIIVRSAELALDQAIQRGNESMAHQGLRSSFSSITPFNWRTPTATFTKIAGVLEQLARANRFNNTTPGPDTTTQRHGFEEGDRVRIIANFADLDRIDAPRDSRFAIGTITNLEDNGIDVDIPGLGNWWFETTMLELA